MIDFHWRDDPTLPLERRFPDQALGIAAWRALASVIETLGARSEAPVALNYAQAFNVFLVAANAARQQARHTQPPCRLLVSHRMGSPDVDHAERAPIWRRRGGMATGSTSTTPLLKYANGLPIQSPALDVLIAAIIEMGLLSSTCVLAGAANACTGLR